MHTYRKTSAYSTEYCLLTKAKYLRLISYTMYSLRKICKNNYTMYTFVQFVQDTESRTISIHII